MISASYVDKLPTGYCTLCSLCNDIKLLSPKNVSRKAINSAWRVNVFSETYTKGGILVCVFQEDME